MPCGLLWLGRPCAQGIRLCSQVRLRGQCGVTLLQCSTHSPPESCGATLWSHVVLCSCTLHWGPSCAGHKAPTSHHLTKWWVLASGQASQQGLCWPCAFHLCVPDTDLGSLSRAHTRDSRVPGRSRVPSAESCGHAHIALLIPKLLRWASTCVPLCVSSCEHPPRPPGPPPPLGTASLPSEEGGARPCSFVSSLCRVCEQQSRGEHSSLLSPPWMPTVVRAGPG